MATKDDRPGLLSKVAMFVRNPTRDWSELDQQSDGDATGYDKQALKAMIERKRQNDFVRKREFDQLRKLRNRDPGTLASMARPSFFQTSLATDLDGRAVTLKKIDEIEAQMSRQWWKARAQDSQISAATVQGSMEAPASADAPKDDTKPYTGPAGLSLPFASTEPMVRSGEGEEAGDMLNEFAPTLMASDPVLAASSTPPEVLKFEPSVGFSASALFAIEADELATDPELEEAAIRFANSDDAGAEQGLMAALRGSVLEPQAAQSWTVALLDFYRATTNQAGFEAAAREFAPFVGGVQLAWSALGPASTDLIPPMDFSPAQTFLWAAGPNLGAHHLEDLLVTMSSHAAPWHLDWSALRTIAPDALPTMGALFASLCGDAVRLHFHGHASLVRSLRDSTPSGNRDVSQAWWQLRLNALRAMGLQDEFELAALDFCITFEAAPPEWSAATCQIDLAAAQQADKAYASGQTVPMGLDLLGSSAGLPLRGEFLGDATQALAALDTAAGDGKRLVIDCSELVRVDFAAAGSLLNWVSMRQAEGTHVQFKNVHRLVAAFFNVIGINEYAKVIPRAV